MSKQQQLTMIMDAYKHGIKLFFTEEGQEKFINMLKEEYDMAAEFWIESAITA